LAYEADDSGVVARLRKQNYQRWMQSLFDGAEVVKSPRVKSAEGQQDDRVLLLPYVRESYSTIASTSSLPSASLFEC
jgi:hypothetical protein